MVEMDAETCFVGASHQRIQPVRADDQIRIQIVQRLDMLRKADFDAEGLGALAQDFDQLKTAECRETDAIQDHLTGGRLSVMLRHRSMAGVTRSCVSGSSAFRKSSA